MNETTARPNGGAAVRGNSCDLRLCPQCGNTVSDPLVVQCPRCWTKLPRMSCAGCKGCPLGR